MLDIVGYKAVQNGYTIYYHAACVLRLQMFDDPTMPNLEDCEPIFHGDRRDRLHCEVCNIPMRERSPVQGGYDVITS